MSGINLNFLLSDQLAAVQTDRETRLRVYPSRYPRQIASALTHVKNSSFPFVTLSLLLQCFTICGCDQSPPDAGKQQSSSLPTQIATESQMHEVASKQCIFHVLKNVDRPFDAKLEPGCIYINPTDPVFAQCVMYCTHEVDGKQTRSLFFVTLDNNVYPKFAAKPDELHCVLVNRDGKVVFKDNDYWEGDTQEELLQAGAADSDGPPLIATGLLEMAELRKKYNAP